MNKDGGRSGSWECKHTHAHTHISPLISFYVFPSVPRALRVQLADKSRGGVPGECAPVYDCVCIACLHRLKVCLSKQKRDSESMVCARVLLPPICNQVSVSKDVYTAH